MLCFTTLRRCPGQAAAGGDQVGWVEGAPAVLALVTPRLRIATVGARPLDVSVGQEAFGLGVEELAGSLFGQIPVVEESEEHVLGDRRWFAVPVEVYRSQEMPTAFQLTRNSA